MISRDLHDLLRADGGLVPASSLETILAGGAARGIAPKLGAPLASADLVTSRMTVAERIVPRAYSLRPGRDDLCSVLVPLASDTVLADHSTADGVLLLGV